MKLKKYLLAIPMVLGAIGIGQVSHASDYGCTVLLCLSDPRGPRTESECRPSIDRLFRDLRKGRGFPSCAMAGNPDTGVGSFARVIYDPFDPCPSGLSPRSGYIAQGNEEDFQNKRNNRWNRWGNNTTKYGYSDTRIRGGWGESTPRGPRACVGKRIGSYSITVGSGDNRSYETVTVYDEVLWQQRQTPNAIDVFIDGGHYKRVRW